MDISQQLDRYIIQSQELGRGSFGIVYKAEDSITNSVVAIKKIPSIGTLNEKMTEILKKEIALMIKLNHTKNPHLLTLLDYKITESHGYIVTKLCNGNSLRNLLNKSPGGIINEIKVSNIIKQISKAFIDITKSLDNNNMLYHRDIKPDNILFSDNELNHVIIADYGLAKIKDEALINYQKNSSRSGTPAYMSPQVIDGDDYTAKCDVYSLGMVGIECLLGKTLTRRQVIELQENPQSMDRITGNKINVDIRDLLLKMLAIEESNRLDWYGILNHKALKRSKCIYVIDEQEQQQQEPKDKETKLLLSRSKIDVEALNTKFINKELELKVQKEKNISLTKEIFMLKELSKDMDIIKDENNILREELIAREKIIKEHETKINELNKQVEILIKDFVANGLIKDNNDMNVGQIIANTSPGMINNPNNKEINGPKAIGKQGQKEGNPQNLPIEDTWVLPPSRLQLNDNNDIETAFQESKLRYFEGEIEKKLISMINSMDIRTLRDLEIGPFPFKEATFKSLVSSLVKFEALLKLSLDFSRYTDIENFEMIFVAQLLNKLPNLTSLFLNFEKPKKSPRLAISKTIAQSRVMDIAQVLPTLSKLTCLSLNFSKCYLDDEDAIALKEAISTLTQLSLLHLNLIGCDISNDGKNKLKDLIRDEDYLKQILYD